MDFLTIRQICKELGVSRFTVYGWIRSGELPAVDLALGEDRSMYRVRRTELETFIRGRSANGDIASQN